MNKFNKRELATVLAALRLFQANPDYEMTHFEEVKALTYGEIDNLCERLNTYEI